MNVAVVLLLLIISCLWPPLLPAALSQVPSSPVGFVTPMVLDEDNDLMLMLQGDKVAQDRYDVSPGMMRRATRGTFPYSTISYYRSLRPLLLSKYKQVLQEDGHPPMSAKELAELVDVLEGRAKKSRDHEYQLLVGSTRRNAIANNAMRGRRSNEAGGGAIKRYACRFKFCRIFSPIDE